MDKELGEAIIAAMLMFESEINRMEFAIQEGIVEGNSIAFLRLQQEICQNHFDIMAKWLEGALEK